MWGCSSTNFFTIFRCRQHQRLTRSGVTLSRTTLTNLSKRAIELLRPIAVAQLEHVLQSKVLAMDETPIKAGRQGLTWSNRFVHTS
ncbi:IS66 family transposase [Oleiphilus messinensis]|uniref:IS66 family transposase n=1 Tax=Oleiphilus messinensis TaxID=141451 RepID=UPI000B3B5F88|nr:transposase [Oleiphilus messinensis]